MKTNAIAGGIVITNGNGYKLPDITLNDATGDEVAFVVNVTVNKATSGDGTGIQINYTDTDSPEGSDALQINNSSALAFAVRHDGQTTIENKAILEGITTTVTNKNKTTTYLSDSIGNYLIFQPEYWTGSAFAATENYAFGHFAQQSNTGTRSNAIGYKAQQANTGINSNAFGYSSQQFNTGSFASAFGYVAQQSNSGSQSSAFGYSAQQNNSGSSSSSFGFATQQFNSGGSSSAFGYETQRYNLGTQANAFGLYAQRYNVGTQSNAVGNYAQNYNTGANANSLGYNTLYYNQNDDNVAIGDSAWSTFSENTAGNKTFDNTDIDVGTDRITVTSHGFGATGKYVNIKYTQGTSPITGLANATIYQVKIIDANTVGFYENSRGINITAAGSGTGHTFTPQYDYENTTVIGSNVEPTASNQVILGNDLVEETRLKGVINVSVNAGIIASAGSAQGGSPLTARVNEISTCATTGDSVTLISAPSTGSIEQTIINNGANACDVFPASGDNLGAGVDTAVSLAAGANITYISYDNTNWVVKT